MGFHCFQSFGKDLEVVSLSPLFMKSLSRHPPKYQDVKETSNSVPRNIYLPGSMKEEWLK